MISFKTKNDAKRSVFLIISLLLTVLCIIFIFSNSLKSAPSSAEQSSSVQGFANSLLHSLGFDSDLSHKFIRKAAHIAEFALLGALFSLDFWLVFKLSTSDSVKKSVKILSHALPYGAIIAAVDELLQLTSEGRSAQISDFLIDLLGAALGILFIWLIFIIFRAVKLSKSE